MTVVILLVATFMTAALSLVGGVLFLSKFKIVKKIQTAGPLIAAVVLLWAVFGDIIPEILESEALATTDMLLLILAGLGVCAVLGFVLGHFHHHADLSKQTGIRHVDLTENERSLSKQLDRLKSSKHTHDLTESKMMLAVDTIHNVADGLVLGASFAAGVPIGLAACLATIAHEIPQEIADFSVMQKAKIPRHKIIKYQFLSALALVPAALVSFICGGLFEGTLPIVLSLVAGFLIYIAISELFATFELIKSHLPNQLKT